VVTVSNSGADPSVATTYTTASATSPAVGLWATWAYEDVFGVDDIHRQAFVALFS
jgi:hypothetical protein